MVPPVSDRVPPAPPYSGTGSGSGAFRVRGCHPLRRAFPGGFRYAPFFRSLPALQPRARLDARGLGWSPFARRYSGSHCCFPFLRLLRCFSSAGWQPHKVDCTPCSRVSPFGHPRINGRSRLPAAFRSLPRPSSPPGAKASPARPLVLVAYRACPAAPSPGAGPRVSSLLFFPSELYFACHSHDWRLIACFCVFPHPFKEPLSAPRPVPSGPVRGRFVESKGVEPLTPSLQSWCSSQLS